MAPSTAESRLFSRQPYPQGLEIGSLAGGLDRGRLSASRLSSCSAELLKAESLALTDRGQDGLTVRICGGLQIAGAMNRSRLSFVGLQKNLLRAPDDALPAGS